MSWGARSLAHHHFLALPRLGTLHMHTARLSFQLSSTLVTSFFIPGRARTPRVISAVAVEGVHHKPEPEPAYSRPLP